ncbi:MAG: hypothetical protein DMG09_15515 [Acidobacteria bacterium]|nr:MAG: hypothetical protein DMG09_15515 [Acidobacteriota bacterium]
MARLPCQIIVGALLATSFWNAAMSIRQYYHPLVFDPDGWIRLENDLAQAKKALGNLPDHHIEYRLKEASDTYDYYAFYRLQHILAPTILCQDGLGRRYVLVEFWTTKQVRPLPGLNLVEDLGHGLALYKRPLQ